MKVRNGFVSNSSTSSFLIYGVCFSEDELYDKLGIEEEPEEGVWEILEELAEELDMEYNSPYDWGENFLGISWDQVGDDETGGEFKAKIEKKLKEKFGNDIQCDTHEGAWRDG
jgi:hypothetical protein